MRELLLMFVTVFVAELGDKTQVATLLFVTEHKTPPFAVFCASAGALVLGTAVSVLVGTLASRYLGFTAIGIWTLVEYFRGGAA
jgi:putative Ca2+/H+ antiporter (TMEM165/GDT1 family)